MTGLPSLYSTPTNLLPKFWIHPSSLYPPPDCWQKRNCRLYSSSLMQVPVRLAYAYKHRPTELQHQLWMWTQCDVSAIIKTDVTPAILLCTLVAQLYRAATKLPQSMLHTATLSHRWELTNQRSVTNTTTCVTLAILSCNKIAGVISVQLLITFCSLTDRLGKGFTSHSTQNKSFRRRSSQPIYWLCREESKLNPTQQNQAKQEYTDLS